MDEAIRVLAKRISTDLGVEANDLPALRAYVEDWLDPKWLARQLSDYQTWAKDNSDPVLQAKLLHRPPGTNALIAAIWAARWWEEQRQQDPSYKPPMGAKRIAFIAAPLAVTELHAGNDLDSANRSYLRQRLQASDQLLGVVHECTTVAYFIIKGAYVKANFLTKGSPEEITVKWKGIRVPVQCKVKQPGAGRAISHQNFETLAACIAVDVKRSSKRALVKIGATGNIRDEDIEFLRQRVRVCLDGTQAPVLYTNGGRTFSVHVQRVSGSFTAETITDFLKQFDLHIVMAIGLPAPGKTTQDAEIVIGIDAKPTEHPWRSLRNSIQDAEVQLRHGPPGLIAVHYSDPIPEFDFETLRPHRRSLGEELRILINGLPHVAGVILSCEPDLQLPGSGGPGKSWSVVVDSRLPSDFPLGEPVI